MFVGPLRRRSTVAQLLGSAGLNNAEDVEFRLLCVSCR
jgi:hypothetical protein